MPKRVLVTGGTGTVGTPLVAALLADGHDVGVLSRRVASPGVPYRAFAGDLVRGTGLDEAVCGVEVVVHCATTPKGDVRATRPLLDAAACAGVGHLVYVSIVGVDGFPMIYYRTKAAVEELVRGSPVPWTILRATQFHDLVFRIFDVQRRFPVLFVPVGMPVQPVAAAEVATRLAELAGAEPAGRVPDMGGPAVAWLEDLAREYGRARGDRRRIITFGVPGKAGRAYRQGRHLAPGCAVGRATFAEFLAEQVG